MTALGYLSAFAVVALNVAVLEATKYVSTETSYGVAKYDRRGGGRRGRAVVTEMGVEVSIVVVLAVGLVVVTVSKVAAALVMEMAAVAAVAVVGQSVVKQYMSSVGPSPCRRLCRKLARSWDANRRR